MKLTLKCNSPLLDQTLQIYLDKYLFDDDIADMVITDTYTKSSKPIFYIGFDDRAHLKVPFTKHDLFKALEHEYQKDSLLSQMKTTKGELELLIGKLNKKHQDKIEKLLKNYHEKI